MTFLLGLVCPALSLVGYGILFSAALTPRPPHLEQYLRRTQE